MQLTYVLLRMPGAASAGRYIGITEADYEWITDEIVQVANRCEEAAPAGIGGRSCMVFMRSQCCMHRRGRGC
jgi:hypothetical protein